MYGNRFGTVFHGVLSDLVYYDLQVENQFVYRHFRQITPFWVNFDPFVLRRYYVSCHGMHIPIN